LLYPLGLSVGLGLTGFILLVLKKRQVALWFYGFSLGILFFFSLPFISNILLYTLESRYPAQTEFPQVSAIVLLGGAGVPFLPPLIYPEFNEAGDRIFHAARLFKKELAPRIIITGGKYVTFRKDHMTEAQNNAYFLSEFCGIDSSALVLEKEAANTYQNGICVDRIFKKNNWGKKIILVTSAYHMPRSVLIFRKLGFQIYPAPTDFNSYASFSQGIFDFFPSIEALRGSTTALHEVYGMVGYMLARWM
jgi:uncharacterized SAM-binding protein YcdF (DUF218 family)